MYEKEIKFTSLYILLENVNSKLGHVDDNLSILKKKLNVVFCRKWDNYNIPSSIVVVVDGAIITNCYFWMSLLSKLNKYTFLSFHLLVIQYSLLKMFCYAFFGFCINMLIWSHCCRIGDFLQNILIFLLSN